MQKSALATRVGLGLASVIAGFAGFAGFAGLSLAHSEEGAADDGARLEASLEKWKEAKVECGGNYTIEVSQSFFTGARNTTTVTVRDNKVVGRKFSVSGEPRPVAPGKEPHGPEVKWEEKGEELGSNGAGALAPKTLDELYAEAKVILENGVPDNNRRSLRFDERGLLSCCYLMDTRIADDAPMVGVKPMRITLGEK